MRPLTKILLICFALWLPLAGNTADTPERPLQFVQSGGKSLNEAVEQVRRQYPNGRIINAETKVKNGREVHHVRVMVDGKVKTVRVNGRRRG